VHCRKEFLANAVVVRSVSTSANECRFAFGPKKFRPDKHQQLTTGGTQPLVIFTALGYQFCHFEIHLIFSGGREDSFTTSRVVGPKMDKRCAEPPSSKDVHRLPGYAVGAGPGRWR
jgi:hypothetical protein